MNHEASTPIVYYATSEGNPPNGDVQIVRDLCGETSRYRWIAPEQGRHGITVTPRSEAAAAAGEDAVTLPGIVSRYHRGDGLIYILDAPEIGGTYHATAEDVANGAAFRKIGTPAHAEWMKSSANYAKELRTIWYEVAHAQRTSAPSPTVLEGYPPLAPALAPVTSDEQRAADAWAWIGGRLSPFGRLAVGMALFSPWLDEVAGTSMVLALWGQAGEGKSVLAHVIAALFGNARKAPTLFATFDSSPQGIPAAAQDLSYFPMILDEVQTGTGDVEPILTRLVMGAQRKRASRAGSSIASEAAWRGLAITTSNDPIKATHEMFDRRLLTVPVTNLWTDVPQEDNANDSWWREIWRSFDSLSGWPWEVVCRSYTPGTPRATDVLTAVEAIPLPGRGSLGNAGRLGIFGASWLAAWTGDSSWLEGVEQAARDLVAERRAEAINPARDASARILEHWQQNPGAWEMNAEHPGRDLYGFKATDMLGRSCNIDHEDDCLWINLLAERFDEVAQMDSRRAAASRLRGALYSPEKGHLNRKVRVREMGRPRVFTMCTEALSELADGGQQQQPTAKVIPLPRVEREQTTFERLMGWPAGYRDGASETSTPEPVAQAPETSTPEPRERVWAHGGDDWSQALREALAADATDLVGPPTWDPMRSTPDGWDAHGWEGRGTGSGELEHVETGRKVRVWRADGRTTPEDYAAGLSGFMADTGSDFRSIPAFAQATVRDYHEGKRAPRWLLPDEQADLWGKPGSIMAARQWGTREASEGATQYDRTASYLPAIRQANVVPLYRGEAFDHYDDNAPIGREWAGMYRIEVPHNWPHVLPAPHGTSLGGADVWTSAEIMRLYSDSAARYGTPMPVIIEAWLATPSRVAGLHAFAERVDTWLSVYPKGDHRRMVPKRAYQSLAGSMMSPHVRKQLGSIYRPDWGAAIADNSWASVIRRAWKAYDADQRFVPVRVNVDAIYYPPGLPEPPGLPMGDRPGAFHRDGE